MFKKYFFRYSTFRDAPYVGFFKIRQPGVLIRDPEIIKDVLIKDFHYFEKNDAHIDEEVDPIGSKNPFLQYGERWKISRSQMSYCFSSGKVSLLKKKHFFHCMKNYTNHYVYGSGHGKCF